MKAFFFLSEWVINFSVDLVLYLIIISNLIIILKQIKWRNEP